MEVLVFDTFDDIRMWLAVRAETPVIQIDPEEEAPPFTWPAPLTWWGYGVAPFTVVGLLTALALEAGPTAKSIAVFIALVSLGHFFMMLWLRPVVKTHLPQEINRWFDGHMKNYVWGAVFGLLVSLFV